MNTPARKINYCGRHIHLDIWVGENDEYLRRYDSISLILKDAAKDAGATVVGENFHEFGNRESEGYTGFIILAESHISIHTWPEYGYAGIDIFMCGDCNPNDSIQRIIEHFSDGAEKFSYETSEHFRGVFK